MNKCFACDHPLGKNPALVTVSSDDQNVFVGRNCFQRITAAGVAGYQPPLGGPRLYLMECKPPKDAA